MIYKEDPNIHFKAFYEIDYPSVISSKLSALNSIPKEKISFSSHDYFAIPGDLNDWNSIVTKMMECGFDLNLPTIFISECVLIYLESKFSDFIIQWAASNIQISLFLAFEQILPNDPFGRVMIRNLKIRNIQLPGLNCYPTLATQKQRYLELGYEISNSVDLNYVEDNLSSNERSRINKLEMMDEFEEARLLDKHYCITWASKGMTNLFCLSLK